MYVILNSKYNNNNYNNNYNINKNKKLIPVRLFNQN